MLDALIVLVLVGFVAVAWHDALTARDLARRLSQRLCAEAGVQLLDQTVALRRLALARAQDGGLSLRRWYSFDVSTDGSDRHRGSLRLLRGKVEEYSVPQRVMDLPTVPTVPLLH
jgi:hypothetical protein